MKCEKSQPSCRNCVRRGEICHYPARHVLLQRRIDDHDGLPASVTPPGDSHQAEASFSALDVELFHRFITTDYPPFPPDSTETWTRIMPTYAHDHDFLMYAILACSATNSTGEKRPELRVSALRHRMRALTCIWGTMAVADDEQTSTKTRDSLFGAWYLLAVQSFRLRDGWMDFFPLLRGLHLVSRASLVRGDDTIWRAMHKPQELQKRIQDEWNDGKIERPPLRFTSTLMASLKHVKVECHIDRAVLGVLTASATALDKDDIWVGYIEVQKMWELLSDTDSVDFKDLEDCSKPSMRMLIAHWLAIILLLKPFYDLEVLLGRQGVVAQLPTWIFDIAQVSARDLDDTGVAMQWPVEVASVYSTPDSPCNSH